MQWPLGWRNSAEPGLLHAMMCVGRISGDVPLMLLDQEIFHVRSPLEHCTMVCRVLVLL